MAGLFRIVQREGEFIGGIAQDVAVAILDDGPGKYFHFLRGGLLLRRSRSRGGERDFGSCAEYEKRPGHSKHKLFHRAPRSSFRSSLWLDKVRSARGMPEPALL